MTECADPAVDILATQARGLLRASVTATLATTTAEGEMPYASWVTVACRHDGAPVLSLSERAEHTRNIAKDNRVALLCDGTDGVRGSLNSPLTKSSLDEVGMV